jgi:hypothetical protein
MAWTASTTLLQKITEDKFRGRVFSSEYAMSMSILAAITYASGVAIDAGWSVRAVCAVAGGLILAPALWWFATAAASSDLPASSSGTDR